MVMRPKGGLALHNIELIHLSSTNTHTVILVLVAYFHFKSAQLSSGLFLQCDVKALVLYLHVWCVCVCVSQCATLVTILKSLLYTHLQQCTHTHTLTYFIVLCTTEAAGIEWVMASNITSLNHGQPSMFNRGVVFPPRTVSLLGFLQACTESELCFW